MQRFDVAPASILRRLYILWGCWVSPWDISNTPAERAISTILHYPDAKTASLAPHRHLFKVTLTLIFAAENMSGNYQVRPWWYRFTEVLSLFCYGPFCQGFIRGFSFVSFYFIFFFHLLFFPIMLKFKFILYNCTSIPINEGRLFVGINEQTTPRCLSHVDVEITSWSLAFLLNVIWIHAWTCNIDHRSR